jgi:hypothetical protein
VTRARRSALSGSADRKSGAARDPPDTACPLPGSATVRNRYTADRKTDSTDIQTDCLYMRDRRTDRIQFTGRQANRDRVMQTDSDPTI